MPATNSIPMRRVRSPDAMHTRGETSPTNYPSAVKCTASKSSGMTPCPAAAYLSGGRVVPRGSDASDRASCPHDSLNKLYQSLLSQKLRVRKNLRSPERRLLNAMRPNAADGALTMKQNTSPPASWIIISRWNFRAAESVVHTSSIRQASTHCRVRATASKSLSDISGPTPSGPSMDIKLQHNSGHERACYY